MPFYYFILVTLFSMIMSGCIERYYPEDLKKVNSHLIVEGFIEAGDTTHIHLSYSRNIEGGNVSEDINNANVFLEDENHTIQSFNYEGSGTYKTFLSEINTNHKYKLRIELSNGKEYFSEWIEMKVSPPIEELSWKSSTNGVQLYLSTFDPSGNGKYYRWDFVETWKFHTPYLSQFIYDNQLRPRDLNTENIYECYRTETSQDIILATSDHLSEDRIYKNPFYFINTNSDRLQIKYSILVKQYALTKEAFEYWELLKKSTEKIGSLFDPQPSQNVGNMHCANNEEEIVVGYISGGKSSTKRIYINNIDLPYFDLNWNASKCSLVKYRGVGTFEYMFGDGSNVAIGYYKDPEALDPAQAPLVLMYSSRDCADCTTRGSLEKPVFWED